MPVGYAVFASYRVDERDVKINMFTTSSTHDVEQLKLVA